MIKLGYCAVEYESFVSIVSMDNDIIWMLLFGSFLYSGYCR